MRRSSLLQGGDDAFRRGQMFAGRDYTPLHIYYRKSNGEECICPIGCYNSCEDIAIISFLLLTLWCLLLALYALLLKAALDASESGTALWIFFWLGFCFVCLVHSAVYMGSQEAKNNKDEEE